MLSRGGQVTAVVSQGRLALQAVSILPQANPMWNLCRLRPKTRHGEAEWGLGPLRSRGFLLTLLYSSLMPQADRPFLCIAIPAVVRIPAGPSPFQKKDDT